MMDRPVFSGSYLPNDVTFLLTRIEMEPMSDLDEKERLIQTGQRHYSELISIERQPSDRYLRLFHKAVEENVQTMARDLIRVARVIVRDRPQGIVIVSLARAGTPVGVALKRLYAEGFGLDVPHYSISIIRDRGIDEVALDYVCERHNPSEIAFVDGWTGKGAITSELHGAIPGYNKARGVSVPHDLFVLADLAGTSGGCGSTDDYLIPSSILNATVSGLVSRTILNEAIGPEQFHGCLFYEHLASQDLSRWFIDRLILASLERLKMDMREPIIPCNLLAAATRSEALISDISAAFAVGNRHYIKPGIGEATRSLLRRTPRILCLKTEDDPETEHLRVLANERAVPISIRPALPLKAAAIIKDLGYA